MITIGLTMGDPLGIGPEVILGALNKLATLPETELPHGSLGGVTFILFGNRYFWESAPGLHLEDLEGTSGLKLEFVETSPEDPYSRTTLVPSITAGKGQTEPRQEKDRLKLAGQTAFQALETGVNYLKEGNIDGLVTGPVDKSRIAMATGEPFTGQTEYLARRHGMAPEEVLMILAGETLRVGLATTHLPVSAISTTLTTELITSRLTLFRDALCKYWGIPRPRIGVCSLNPHGGDHGLFGDEEERLIVPAIERMGGSQGGITGPYAADSLFPAATRGSLSLDGILAMYHDQGLPPLKMWEYQKAVNITIGLPRVRVSPDHGTADDLAGTGKASCSSAYQAITTAIRMVNTSKRGAGAT